MAFFTGVKIMIDLLSKFIDTINDDQFDLAISSNFQSPGVYFYSKDKNGKFLSCNNYMACAVGLNKGIDMLGHTDFDFVWSEEATLYRENDQKIIYKNEPILFLEPSVILNGSNHTKIHLLTYKRPLRTNSKKIIGIIGLSFIINGRESPFNSIPENQSFENLESYEKCLFYSNLESRYNLTKRQKEVLYYLSKGMSLKQIARVLNLSPRTIEHHIELAKIKLDCFSRTHLIEKMHSEFN